MSRKIYFPLWMHLTRRKMKNLFYLVEKQKSYQKLISNGNEILKLSPRHYPIKCQCCSHIETSQLICCANQLTGFYMRETLAFMS